MRLFWLLPKAAPALLRHLAAYAELAGLDIERAQRRLAAQLVTFAMVAVSAFLALLMGCFIIIAYTWDTHYRVAAIAWLGGGFFLVAVIASIYRIQVNRGSAPFLSSVRREWQEDRVILERLLSSDQE